MPSIYFEDLEPGRTTTFGRKRVTEEEIVAFAKAYDAQPFHLSEEAAKGTFVGRLIASGWHTIAMQMRMLCDAWILDAAGLGSPGVEELHWLKPVLPGDVLQVRQTILGAQPSRSRPGMGVVRFRFETLNEDGDVVMRQVNPIMFTRREAAEPEAKAGADKRHTVTVQDEFGALRPSSGGIPQVLRPFEELEVGATDFLGEHVFEAEDIVSFARSFDPQPFHLSDDAARRPFRPARGLRMADRGDMDASPRGSSRRRRDPSPRRWPRPAGIRAVPRFPRPALAPAGPRRRHDPFRDDPRRSAGKRLAARMGARLQPQYRLEPARREGFRVLRLGLRTDGVTLSTLSRLRRGEGPRRGA